MGGKVCAAVRTLAAAVALPSMIDYRAGAGQRRVSSCALIISILPIGKMGIKQFGARLNALILASAEELEALSPDLSQGW